VKRVPLAWVGAVAAAALLVAALRYGPERRPATPGQTELRLAVESLATDGDLAYAPADAERFRARFGAAALEGFRLEGASRHGRRPAAGPAGAPAAEPELPRLRAPWAWVHLAATARRLGGWPAVFFLQWLYVAGAGLLLAWGLRPRLGTDGAALFSGVALLASAASLATLWLVPEALLLFAAAAAGAAVWGRRRGPSVELGDVYGGELTEREGRWRWPVAGVAFGLVAAGSPAYLPLAWPLAAAAPRGRRALPAALLLGSAGLVFAVVALAGGRPWPPLELWYDPHLLGWATVGLVAGRFVGAATWYLPALVALAVPSRDEGRRFIPWAVVAALAFQVVTSPFDLAGDSGAAGNAWFLPLFALILLLPARNPRGALGGAALASLLLVAPAGLDATGLAGRPWARGAASLRAWLPLDTTLRTLPGTAEIDRSGIVLRGFAPAVFRGADGRLRLAADAATLMVVSAAPLGSIRLELGAEAPADIRVSRARAGDLVLRPDGGVALDVRLGAPDREHPTWSSPHGAAIYVFRLELPRAPVAPLPLDLSLARPLGASERPGEAP
jgi:hypothetical protein